MTALVTGGTRGIGYAVVEELAELGALVHTCSRNESELNERLQEWSGKGFTVTGSVCDLASHPQREQLSEKVSSVFGGKLNILINNVGTNFAKPTLDYTTEEYSFLMATNLESCYHMSQLAHPLLKASGVGNFVFISSVISLLHTPYGSIYSAAKAAINQITKNLAYNVVFQRFLQSIDGKEFLDGVAKRTPLKRIAEANEVSSLVAFLCLPAASLHHWPNHCC
ncbi:hypothetical protein L2E82_22443 [Cichorium intybus]|uniref:Uncharacterized protein n=1 Tax=Cichorium intybus TaxID=13427 RepID=A0ACB9DX89_CICIN|nr:hypothetical protein L2E82_22443 [Cichorium intybus]